MYFAPFIVRAEHERKVPVVIERATAETITTAANRIVNEVKNINRVMFDYTTKPPATSEFE
ncbi:MAG: hypothetical protein WAV19_13625 [Blautia wexlerae]